MSVNCFYVLSSTVIAQAIHIIYLTDPAPRAGLCWASFGEAACSGGCRHRLCSQMAWVQIHDLHLAALLSWISPFTSLSHHFLFCKVEMIYFSSEMRRLNEIIQIRLFAKSLVHYRCSLLVSFYYYYYI